MKAFQDLKEKEFDRAGLQWHIRKITDNIDEARNFLDTIPGQSPELNRIEQMKKINKKKK